MKKIGVALGGGGARGMAHIPVIEALDRLEIRPTEISGTSMGAIFGAMYASGLRGEEIRGSVDEVMFSTSDSLKSKLSKIPELMKVLFSVSPHLNRGGFISVEKLLGNLLDDIQVERFEELKIPLKVVTTDFWTGEKFVITSGPLLPAIKASMSIPGLFPPVELDGRILVDGGVVDNVPWTILEDSEFTLAVDVAPSRTVPANSIPNVVDSVLGMFDIMIERSVKGSLAASPPDLYVKPEIHGVRTLDFDKFETVYSQAQPEITRMEEKLQVIFRPHQ